MLVAERTATEWVEAFAEGWRAPTDAESFCDHFEPYLADDIRLVQPQLPEVIGKQVGGRSVALHTVDKITLRDGVATERVATRDPLELLGAVLRSPRSWPTFVRARLRR